MEPEFKKLKEVAAHDYYPNDNASCKELRDCMEVRLLEFEEVGIKANSVSLLGSINDCVKYEIPKKSRRNRFLKKKIIGQKQKWYMFKLNKDVIISFDNDPDNEFEEFKWVSYWYPLHVIIKFKESVYREVLNELRLIYCKEVLND